MFRTYASSSLIYNKASISFTGYSPFADIGYSFPFNETYGMRAGGRPTGGGTTANFERATYSTETNAVNAARLSSAFLVYGQVVGNATKMLVCGGDTDTGGGSRTNIIRVYTYGTDTAASSASTLTQGGRYKGGGGVGTTIGYIIGGLLAGTTSTTERIVLATEVCTQGVALATSYATSDPMPRAAGNDVILYIIGGVNDQKIQSISFVSDTISTLSATSITNKKGCSARVNPAGSYVYCLGGNRTNSEKIAIATDTPASITAMGTSVANAGVMGQLTKMYTCGGYDSSWSSLAQAVTYATDGNATVTGMNAIACATYTAGI